MHVCIQGTDIGNLTVDCRWDNSCNYILLYLNDIQSVDVICGYNSCEDMHFKYGEDAYEQNIEIDTAGLHCEIQCTDYYACKQAEIYLSYGQHNNNITHIWDEMPSM